MPYRQPAAPAQPKGIVRLPPRQSPVMLLGGLFFGAASALVLLFTLANGQWAGIAGGIIGLLFSLTLCAFTSSGVNADAARGGILRWSGPGFALRKSFYPIAKDHRLEFVTKTVTHRAQRGHTKATITVHTVAFVRDEERVVVARANDRKEARRQAELVAKAFGVDLHEDDEGTRRVISLADLDMPLRSRLLRGEGPKRPKMPTGHALEYSREGPVGTIDLPAPAMNWRPVAFFTAAVGAMLFFGLNRGAESEVPFYLGLSGFAFVFGAILKRLFHYRTRARRESAQIVASPDGLRITLRGMVRSREVRFAVEELEDVDVVQVGNAKAYALLVRSDREQLMLAAGTNRAALRWVRRAIAYHLTR